MKTKIILFLLLVLTIIVLIIVATRIDYSSLEIHTDRAAVVKEMRELNRLETATFTIEKIIDGGTKGNRLQNFLFGDRILLIAHGTVIAGFDFANLSEQDITVNEKEVKIKLPPAQILVATLDNSQTRVYDRQRGILALGEKDLESEARAAAEKSIREAACTAGILKQATDNGKKQLSIFLGALGFSQITLVTTDGSC